jgi:hypothetical protein
MKNRCEDTYLHYNNNVFLHYFVGYILQIVKLGLLTVML